MGKTIRTLWPALLGVALIGFACGWVYSVVVMGHATSPSGWFGDLSRFDWIGWLVQDFLYALIGLTASLILFSVFRFVSGLGIKNSGTASLVSAIVTAVLVIGHYGNLIRIDTAEKAEERAKSEAEGKRVDAAVRSERDACAAAFKNVGWVRYPSLSSAFIIEGCYVQFSAADPPDTVIQYYVSKAESWQPEPQGVRCICRCGDYLFRVELARDTPRVVVFANPTDTFSRKGPGRWPEETTTATTTPAPAAPAQTTSIDLGPAAYPGATQEQSGGKIRYWTRDDVATVRKYYESVGATDKSLNKTNLAETQSFELVVGRQTAYISVMASSSQPQSTLIEILWH